MPFNLHLCLFLYCFLFISCSLICFMTITWSFYDTHPQGPIEQAHLRADREAGGEPESTRAAIAISSLEGQTCWRRGGRCWRSVWWHHHWDVPGRTESSTGDAAWDMICFIQTEKWPCVSIRSCSLVWWICWFILPTALQMWAVTRTGPYFF